jgi:VanZ family protein
MYIKFMKVRLSFFHPAIPAVLLVIWLSGLWLLSSLPGDEVQLPSFTHADKVAHFGYFLGGGFLFAWLVRRLVKWSNWRVALVVFAVVAIVGAVDELHQTWTPGRSGGDKGDWLADVSGGLTGAWIFLTIYALITRPTNSETPAGD